MASHGRRLRAAVGASVAVVGASLAAGASGFWTSDATIAGTTFQADTVISQAEPTCTNVGGVLGVLGSAELTWSNVDIRYEYAWQLVQVSNGNVEASGVVTPTGPAGSTVTLLITSSLLTLGVPGVDFDVVVTARLQGSPAWTAATSTTTQVHTVSLLVGLSMRCGPV